VRQILLSFSLVHLPLLLSVMATFVVNYWMTGSYLSSTYSFGFGTFKSLEWSDPEFMAVLVNPYHGLLTYHPLYLLGFLALIWGYFLLEDRKLRAGVASSIVVLLAHLYLHASWYWWWLADSFGMRGLSISALILVPAFIYLMSKLQRNLSAYYGLLLSSFLAAGWSFLLLLQSDQQVVDVGSLLDVVKTSLRLLAESNLLLPAGAFAILAAFFFCTLSGGRGEKLAASALGTLFFFYLARKLSSATDCGQVMVSFWALYLVVASTLLIRAKTDFLKWPLFVSTCTVYLASAVVFCLLSVTTYDLIRSNSVDAKAFKYLGMVDLDQINSCVEQYAWIPGFEEKKSRLLQYRAHLSGVAINPLFSQ